MWHNKMAGNGLAGKESALITRQETVTAESARAVIAAAFPQFHQARVELLGERWGFRVFEVDAGWLFRFPKRDESVTKLNMERKLLAGLGEWVVISRARYLATCFAIHTLTLGQYLDRPRWVKAGGEALQWIFATRSPIELRLR